jgi:predicted nucleic acid-binding protein
VKVLVDTSVWSQALRRQKQEIVPNTSLQVVHRLGSLIEDGRVAMLGPIRQELLSGIKTQAQFESLRQILSAFPDEKLDAEDYEMAANSFNACRQLGIQGSNTDFLICAVSLAKKWPIFSLDKDFERYQKCLPLILFVN